VPHDDPTLLFTNAGMVQFKDTFLGREKRDYVRATTSQRCVRAGGKHNDLENVGYTARHHTFFEMLGNFSFGDYFKREAINWAWEILTDKKWLAIDPARLTVSVYKDDDEAADLWHRDIKLPHDRIARLDEDENFWPASAPSQGPDGVCGPCSEIFYHTDDGGEVEIWNLVFTQFNRVGDPPDNLRPLPSKNIDTGMGLERAAATLQGVSTNFHIDILKPIVLAAGEVCGVKYDPASDDGRRLRRITDHIRACAMAVHENVYPGAQKEKYVIRRLLRRAVLDGHRMGLREPFLFKLVPAVVEQMKTPYPEITETVARVQEVIKKEEASFLGTLDAGLARIERIFDEMRKQNRAAVDGGEAAELYQTYGVPPELFETIAIENNLAFDWEGFRQAMEQHGETSGRQSHGVMIAHGPIDNIKKVLHEVKFLGYETVESGAELKFIVAQEHLCDHIKEQGREAEITVVLDRTPFYGESGGQVGDTGEIIGEDFKFRVLDTQKDGGLILHLGHLEQGEMHTGAKVTARVDRARREGIRRAHSATHILHHALQKNLGTHAQQQGSKVEDDYLRFDFTNMAPVATEQLEAIEHDVNQRVAADEPVEWKIVPLAEARKAGAMMLFGEKYPDPVRMVSMGEFSRELCGGTHLEHTGQVGPFEIIAEEAVSAGTRRIVALTGEKARENVKRTQRALLQMTEKLGVAVLDVPEAVKRLANRVRDLKKQLSSGAKSKEEYNGGKQTWTAKTGEPSYAQMKAALRDAARTLNVSPFDAPERVEAMLAEVEQLKRQLAELAKSGDISADALLEKASDVSGVKVVVADLPAANPNLMRQLIDQMRQKASPIAVLLAAAQGEDKVLLVAGISRELVDRGLSAGKWVGEVAPVVGGGGGGRPDMAQAGGKQPEKLPEALDKARSSIAAMLAG
jgi:alanyl-tRNA synthetase